MPNPLVPFNERQNRLMYVDSKGSKLVMYADELLGSISVKKTLIPGRLTESQRLARTDLLSVENAEITSIDTGITWRVVSGAWQRVYNPVQLNSSGEIASEDAASYRQAGGLVGAMMYPEWLSGPSQGTAPYNPFPWSWIKKYPNRIPLGAIDTDVPRAWNFTGSKTLSWSVGANTTLTPGANGFTQTGTGTNPTLVSPDNLNLAGSESRYIEIMIKRTGGTTGWTGQMYFSTTDEPTFHTDRRVFLAQPTWVTDTFVRFEIDTVSNRTWAQSIIRRIRLDLGNSASDAFEIQSIKLMASKAETKNLILAGELQRSMDWHLDEAYRAGVDFFAVCFYWWANNQNIADYALNLLESSTRTKRPKHCILWANHDVPAVTSQAQVDLMLAQWNARFANPNYFKLKGKPVVYIFDFGKFGEIGVNIGLDGTPGMTTYVQTKLMQLGNAPQGVHLVMCGRVDSPYWVGTHGTWTGRLEFSGASALSGYSYTSTFEDVTPGNVNGGTYGAEWPVGGIKKYSDLVDVGIRRNANVMKLTPGIPYFPTMMFGRDSRPWVGREGYPTVSEAWVLPSPDEVKRGLRNCLTTALQSHFSLPTNKQLAPIVMGYAWDELAEGGIMLPTIGWGYQITNCIKEVFGVAPEA